MFTKTRRDKGFALPTVVIASFALLMVMLVATSAAVSIREGLYSQYYNKIAKEAAESGLQYAKACMDGGTKTWTNPLRPNSGCNGLATQCTSDACYVMKKANNIRTTFSVATPTIEGDASSAIATGTVELLRASDGAVWKTYTKSGRSVKVQQTRPLQWKQITTSIYRTCALASNNQVYCWGNNGYGGLGNNSTTSSSVPVPVTTSGVLSGKTIRQVTAGGDHTCALASDNQVYCWGYNAYGQLGNNSTTNSSVPVPVTTSGALSGKTIRQVAAGSYHTCALASDNQVYCWGYNAYGQLGNNSTTNSSVPVPVTTSGALSGKTIRQVAAGNAHTCALASDNQVYCWGWNEYGGLGNNSTANSSVPVAVTTSGVLFGKTIRQVTAGDYHTCAIASDNQVYCWGNNAYEGQLGNSSSTNSSVPVAVTTSGVLFGKTIRQAAAGRDHTCALASDNYVYCWGGNGHGQLGNNSTTRSLVPVAVSPVADLSDRPALDIQISAGYFHTCALASDNQVYCWGYNLYGQLGIGNDDTTKSRVPVAVTASGVLSGKTIRQITAGSFYSCALASDNQVYCWGYNSYGQLGNNATTNSFVPVAVTTSGALSGKTVRQVAISGSHTCALASDNQVYCWGGNGYGQLGNNTTTNSSVPVAVTTSGALSGKTIRQIAAGGSHACALASDNQVYCWGGNSDGQLGNNTTTNSSVPVPVTTSGVLSGKTIRQVTAGDAHTCVLASDNKVYCWGRNNAGQLGNNSTTNSSVPVAVTTSGALSGKTIRQVTAGDAHTCVLASDNKVYCWGSNSRGQLGNNSTTNSSVPVAVTTSGALSGKTIRQVTAGIYYTCVLASDNQAYCWGYNNYGQLGNNSITISSVPVAVNNLPDFPKLVNTTYFF